MGQSKEGWSVKIEEAIEVINNYKLDMTRPGTLRFVGALCVAVQAMEEKKKNEQATENEQREV